MKENRWLPWLAGLAISSGCFALILFLAARLMPVILRSLWSAPPSASAGLFLIVMLFAVTAQNYRRRRAKKQPSRFENKFSRNS